MRATRAIINLQHLKNNIAAVHSHTGYDHAICMAVKADGYGHGATETAKAAYQAGVNSFGVATVDEGIALRKSGIQSSIILYSIPLQEEVEAMVEYDMSTFAGDLTFVKYINKEAEKQQKTAGIHLKIDTGMGRIGCLPDDAVFLASSIASLPNIKLEGTCTHFPLADTGEQEPTAHQTELFNTVLNRLRAEHIDPGIIHAANSGAVISHPNSWYDMVRPGIILYGLYPDQALKRSLDITPIMELESRITFLKTVPAGYTISYGSTYRTQKMTKIATIPIGYADGYNRLLSNRGKVAIKGRIYPVVGRVCMDQIMVDIGNTSSVQLYDKVTLISNRYTGVTAEDIAQEIGTIPYEITCGISKRVPRVYIS